MSRSQKFRKIVLCLGLEMAALMGAPLRPDELADLFRRKRQAGIHSSVRKDGKDPDASCESSLNFNATARDASEKAGDCWS